MKKIFPGILLAGALLGGCSLLDKIPVESIRIEGQEYRTGFYENLYPANLSFTGKEYEVEGILYHQVESEKFNMIQCDLGNVTTGTIYCEAGQWEEAKAYYAEGENYRYFSEIGGGRTDRESEKKTLETVDIQKFNDLLAFAGENVYEPFRSNSNGQEVIMESPDPDKSPRVDFYKVSKDGYFISDRAYHFYVVNEKLYFLRYFDREEDTMHAVQVPEEIAGYFLELYRERLVKSA